MGSWFWWRAPCLLKTVIVNFKDDPDTAVRGVLWSSRGPYFTLIEPVALAKGKAPQPMDGDVVVHRSNVAFFQVLP